MTDRRSKGISMYADQFGLPESDVEAFFVERYGQRFAGEAIEASGGSAWDDDELSLRDRSLIVVAALVVQGGVDARLRGHVRWAVAHGCTRAELEALCALLANYAGYPKASVGLEIVREELDALGA
jgi:4-carboxymuconolactone decarboxylase